VRFEWDPQKNAANELKHGISFKQASEVFFDPLSATGDDPDHASDERRFITFGLSAQSELLVVVHTTRGDFVRIISARRATRTERKIYEQA
jgi:uncharacterized protein